MNQQVTEKNKKEEKQENLFSDSDKLSFISSAFKKKTWKSKLPQPKGTIKNKETQLVHVYNDYFLAYQGLPLSKFLLVKVDCLFIHRAHSTLPFR